jgi:apolipoprotein D and lipocalin family protein
MIECKAGARVLPGCVCAAVLLLGSIPAAGAAPTAPEPAKSVDAARFYTGVWREIGRRPMKITDGCVAGATEYTLVNATKVKVRDTCTSGTPSGPVKAIGGPATILDPGKNAKLHVSYRYLGLIAVDRDYWVLDHADDYSWFISADPSFDNLWIYTRDPHVDAGERAQLVDRAKALGYDVSKLEFPAQP